MHKLTTDSSEVIAPEIMQSVDELAREGARRMIAEALQLEVEEQISKMRHLRDEQGHALVVRNGTARERTIQLGVGPIRVKAPRVDDRRPGERFTSRILPPYMRRSPRLEEALPVLYLRGLSTGDFSEALPVLLGPEAAGLSASSINRLTKVWQEEYQIWRKRSLSDEDYVYIWADGVYFQVRLDEDRVACLVIMGVLADGRKQVIAIEDGYRESSAICRRVVGQSVARLAGTWPARTGTGRWGWGFGLLGCPEGGVPRDTETTLLGAQDRQCVGQAAQTPASAGQGDAPRDDVRARSG